jgi:tetratricopeptide (TPR) repeat protein
MASLRKKVSTRSYQSDEDTISSAYSYQSAYPISNGGQLTVQQERELERRYSLSKSYIDRGLVKEAEAELKRIIQTAPQDSSVARQSRSMLLKVRKKLDQATFDKAATHVDMGKDFFRSGQYEMAETEFNKALSLDPDNAEAYKDKALLYYNQGQLQEAFEACKRAIALDRTKKEAYVVLGSLYARKGRNEDAVKALKRVSQVSQNNDAVDELASRMISELQTDY